MGELSGVGRGRLVVLDAVAVALAFVGERKQLARWGRIAAEAEEKSDGKAGEGNWKGEMGFSPSLPSSASSSASFSSCCSMTNSASRALKLAIFSSLASSICPRSFMFSLQAMMTCLWALSVRWASASLEELCKWR